LQSGDTYERRLAGGSSRRFPHLRWTRYSVTVSSSEVCQSAAAPAPRLSAAEHPLDRPTHGA